MSHIMMRCVLVGVLAIFGTACGLPLNGLDEVPAGDTAPGSHPTGPGGSPGTHADAGPVATNNDGATTTTPDASAPESGAQQDAAYDADDSSDADDGGDGSDGCTSHGSGKGCGNGGDLRFGTNAY